MKKRSSLPEIPARYQLLVVIGTCILLLALSYYTDLLARPLENAGSFLSVPMQNGITATGEWLGERSEKRRRLEDLVSENAQLKAQNERLVTENTQMQQQRHELDELRELLELGEEYSDYEKTGARIIARDAGNWYHSFIIDKGSRDGIAVNMNVIADGGLVGRITQVGSNWARVKSIIDDDSYVSASVLSTYDTLTVSGSLEQYAEGTILFSRLIDADNLVGEGEKIVTASISDKYLPGILIGYVNTISIDPNNITKSGTILPAVDFAHLNTVLVILETKTIIDEKEE